MAADPSSQAVDRSFSSARHCNTCLGRPEVVPGLRPHRLHEAFAGQAAKKLAYRYWADTARRLGQSHQPRTSEQWSNAWTSPPLGQEVHNRGKLVQEPDAMPHSIQDVLHAEATRPRRRV